MNCCCSYRLARKRSPKVGECVINFTRDEDALSTRPFRQKLMSYGQQRRRMATATCLSNDPTLRGRSLEMRPAFDRQAADNRFLGFA